MYVYVCQCRRFLCAQLSCRCCCCCCWCVQRERVGHRWLARDNAMRRDSKLARRIGLRHCVASWQDVCWRRLPICICRIELNGIEFCSALLCFVCVCAPSQRVVVESAAERSVYVCMFVLLCVGPTQWLRAKRASRATDTTRQKCRRRRAVNSMRLIGTHALTRTRLPHRITALRHRAKGYRIGKVRLSHELQVARAAVQQHQRRRRRRAQV